MLLPVALILFYNTIVLVTVIIALTENIQNNITEAQKHTGIVQARIALACTLFLGLTWLFAFFAAVGELGYVFQVMFTLFSSLHGIFVFVFYTLLNKEVQKEWRKTFVNISNRFNYRESYTTGGELPDGINQEVNL